MKEMIVRYRLSDEDAERLERITVAYREQGLDLPVDEVFETIMFTGSVHDIDRKLRYHEHALRIKED